MNSHNNIILKLSSENADTNKISDSNFTCTLKKDIKNVVGIKLKNASIPFTWRVIESGNNDIYWKTLNTLNNKETVYNTKIPSGTYTTEGLFDNLCNNLTMTELDKYLTNITWTADTGNNGEITSIAKVIDIKSNIYRISEKVSGVTTTYDFRLSSSISGLVLENSQKTINLSHSTGVHILNLGSNVYINNSYEFIPLEYLNCYNIHENRLNIACRWNSLVTYTGLEKPKFAFNRKFLSFRMEKCLGIDDTTFSEDDITDYSETVIGEYTPQPKGPEVIYVDFSLGDTSYIMFTNSLNSEDYSDSRIPLFVNCNYRETIQYKDDIVYYFREPETVRNLRIKIKYGDDDSIVGNTTGLGGVYSYFTFEFITQ